MGKNKIVWGPFTKNPICGDSRIKPGHSKQSEGDLARDTTLSPLNNPYCTSDPKFELDDRTYIYIYIHQWFESWRMCLNGHGAKSVCGAS